MTLLILFYFLFFSLLSLLSLVILYIQVGDKAAILGFVGAPWTIATYIVEGGTTRTYTTRKRMCHTAPHVLKTLLSHLTQAISDYIIYQVNSGAHCIQIFDSWGGQLPPDMWELWSKPYIKEVIWVFILDIVRFFYFCFSMACV